MAADDDERFRAPDFSKPFDLRVYLANTPEDATCKGLFFQDVLKAVRAARVSVSAERLPQLERRYAAFGDYSLREHMDLTTRAAGILYPGVPTREGLRRLGWLVYPGFADSLVGKVIFTIFGEHLDRVYELGPRSFPASLSRGRAATERLGERHWRITFHEIYGFLDCYYVGVMEGPIRRVQKTPDVRVYTQTLSDGVMDVRWSDQPLADAPGRT
jgi:uncharacterized protein (TIGR02265 family)